MLGRRFSLWSSNAQENIARQNVDLISSQFLIAQPDNAGFIPNDEFCEIFAQYLGLPSTCCAPFVGQWIGSEAQDCAAKRDSIIPDLLIHNYPVGDERRKDGNGISQASAPAIFEVK
eukprot:1516997-Ditylum_brightwellii.AAC.1